MKAEIYNALADLNRGFEMALESLKTLQGNGVVTEEYAQDQAVLTEELRAGINHRIIDKLNDCETEDWAHSGKMRVAIETRMKSS